MTRDRYAQHFALARATLMPLPARVVYVELWWRMWVAQAMSETVTQRALARSTGLALTTVNRAVGFLEGTGLVSRDGSTYTLEGGE